MDGQVTFLKISSMLAPSITAASLRSFDTLCRAASIISRIKGNIFQVLTAITDHMATFGLDSHVWFFSIIPREQKIKLMIP